MKKSELREMIRDILKEEMSKMNSLTESPVLDRAPVERNSVKPVEAGSYVDVATDLYNDASFMDTVYGEGTVYSDEVAELIEAAVDTAYPNLNPSDRQKAITEITAELAKLTDVYSDEFLPDYSGTSDDAIIRQIKKDYFDEYGDQY